MKYYFSERLRDSLRLTKRNMRSIDFHSNEGTCGLIPPLFAAYIIEVLVLWYEFVLSLLQNPHSACTFYAR
jgi:hypothetical protein